MNLNARTRPTLRLIANWVGLGALACAAVIYAGRVPNAVPAYAAPRDFSAMRAMSHVQRITLQPHPTGSMGNAAVRAYLLAELRGLGVRPLVQTTTAVGTRYAVAGRVHNVIARIPGTRPGGKAVLLMAHYDAVPVSPGAGDDASGVATLLEVLRVLRTPGAPPLTHDVIALFTDGEESGLLGAAAFVREHPWSKDVGVVMNFEARGTRGPSLMFETGPGNLDVVRVLSRAPGARATSLSTTVYRNLPNDTDLTEFAPLEVPALNFAFIGGVERYHTAQDDQAHLDPRSIQHHGNQALALTRAFANGVLPRPKTSDAVFFDLPLLGLIVYPESFAIVLAILACVLCGVAIYRNREAAGSWGRAAIGGAATVGAVLASGLVGLGLAIAAQRLHAAMRSGSPETSGIYALAIALCAVAITTAVLALVSKRVGGGGARAGALVVWALIAVVVSFIAPGASFLFVWPLIVVAAASLPRRDSIAARAAGWIAAAIALFIIVPIVYLMAVVALGVNQVGGAVIGVFTSLAAALLAQCFEPAQVEGRAYWTSPALAAAGAVVLFAIGAATVRTNADNPAGASLVYAIQPDSAGAWLSGIAFGATARATQQHFLRQVQRDTAASATPPEWLPRGFHQTGIVPVPRSDFPRSEATIVSDSTAGPERRVTVRFRPGPGVYSVAMSVDSGPVLRATVDSKPVDSDRYRVAPRQWSLSYVAPPDSGFLLGLVLPAASRATLAMTTRSDGIPPLRLPPRPEGIVPVQGGNMTWMYYRLRL